MRTLYLDCGMGAAGDMMTAALLELLTGEEKQEFLERMNGLGLPGVKVEAKEAVKCGIVGTHVEVTVYGEAEESLDGHEAGGHHHDHESEGHHHDDEHEAGHHHDHEAGHHHHHDDEPGHAHHHDHGDEPGHAHHHHHADMAGITHQIGHLDLPEEVKADITAVYRLLAEAEAHVHGTTVDQIHFHEVGTADAIADIAGVCLLMHKLAPEQVIASPVHAGSGTVRCAHGILPVPAPAAAHLLEGIPFYSGSIRGELCTPTGAALLKHFVNQFGEMPVMTVSKTGYGMGKKDFERANCLRAFIGETAGDKSEVAELSCNLDDMTPEAVGFLEEELFAAGALEVYTIPLGMKKSRPGILLTCMCRMEDRERMVKLIFLHSTTLGIREQVSRRFTLKRRTETIETPWGPVREKISEGYGVTRRKFEYEDLAAIARERGISLEEARRKAEESRK